MRGMSSMRCNLLLWAILLACGGVAAAQVSTYNLGRPPSEQELRRADSLIAPDGEGLPPGSGTAKQGEVIYLTRGCAQCHGSTGTEGPAPPLVRSPAPPARSARAETPSHEDHPGGKPAAGRETFNWPFAPLLWSWINVGMPLNRHGHLTPDEVYSLTAYVLHRNGVIEQEDVMDAKSLPKVQMPNRAGYVPPPSSEWWKPEVRGR
jgi:cytochrome c